MGKKSRRKGKSFELEIRKDLESKGWIVCRWGNQVEDGKLISARAKYNPFRKVMSMSTGFPDFIAYRKFQCIECYSPCSWEVIGVECKMGKYLDKIEKEKVLWLLNNEIFKYILIAYKKNRGILYEEHLKGGNEK